MHIVLYHDAIIPPPKYGGTERVLYWLTRALASLSHEVTLIAREGSHVEGAEVIGLKPDEHATWWNYIPKSADIVHLNGTPHRHLGFPLLVTIHGNGQPGEVFHPNTVFVSRRHAEIHGSTHYVHNGIDPDDYFVADDRDEYLVFLAKASWSVKNLAGAIEVARAARMPLEVMGNRDWPLGLRRPGFHGIRYHGMVGNEEKRRILSRAKGLLFPVRWDEPFGLAVVEALASGCPVFATPYGSLPEIVTPDCGFLSNHVSEHVSAIQKNAFSPLQCRERVLHHFSHMDMAKRYVRYYEQVLTQGGLQTPAPRRISSTSPKELLPWTD
ncbi:MAG: hypothetical protein A2X94_11125 [Bdellovibrionales bacterium GWB1_55_8]|nr:MAG: hypothetical protein A2X94_11125 [Bdellovibrionales bacterium GWB1_55_8]